MLFERAVKELTTVISKSEDAYINEGWVRAKMESYFEGKRGTSRLDIVIDKFISQNSVEAPTSEILRLSIMQYTFGYFVRDIVYANRFRNDPEKCKAYGGEHTKLLFANALIQWKIMCEQLGYNFEEMLSLGQEHLEERYKDFNRDGWAKL